MTNLARTTPAQPRRATTTTPGPDPATLLARLREGQVGQSPLPPLEPAGYARDHAAFEARSDQRALIADHLAERLSARTGPVAVLSAGCGDGSLDAPLADALARTVPTRPVRYVGIDPFGGSTAAFTAAMDRLDQEHLTTRVHTATFADAELAAEERFDVVTFVHSMYYVIDPVATVLAAYALLRPGGELLVLSGPRGDLNALADVLAPPADDHSQWFSEDVATAFEQAGLDVAEVTTLEARLDLTGASDDVLDFTVQARLTPDLRHPVRAYLDAVSVPDGPGGAPRVPHPVDVYRVRRPD